MYVHLTQTSKNRVESCSGVTIESSFPWTDSLEFWAHLLRTPRKKNWAKGKRFKMNVQQGTTYCFDIHSVSKIIYVGQINRIPRVYGNCPHAVAYLLATRFLENVPDERL